MKTRMSVLSALLFSCILTVVGTIIFFTVQSRIVSTKEAELKNQAQAIAQYYADFVSDFGNTKKNDIWLSAILQSDQKVVVVRSESNVQVQVGRLKIDSPSSYFQPGNRVIQREVFKGLLNHGLYTQVPVFGDTYNTRPIAYIQLFSGMYTVHHYMNTLLAILVLCCILGVFAAAFGGYWITSMSLKPLIKLIALIERIGVQNLHERLHLNGADKEITRLARTFNHMAERLERAFDQQEQFVADASHEIQTPLTAILGHSDLIARWGEVRPEVLKNSTRVIHKETIRLQRLVDDLLTLTRKNVSESYSQSSAAADKIVAEVVADYLPVYEQIQIETDLNVKSECDLAPELLRRVIVNIVSNALKFTAPLGSIQISSYENETSVRIEVRDTGCGIAKEHLPYIFDRFYRVDKARGRNHGGNGLGLAIVKEILSSCRGQIDVDSEVGRGTSVRIEIPKHLPALKLSK